MLHGFSIKKFKKVNVIFMQEIYFDNSATTKPCKEVVDVMVEQLNNTYGNPSALHKKGMEAEYVLKDARETIAKTLCVSAKEIIFTSGGTESNNFAIKGYLSRNRGKHVITTKIEHPSVLNVFKYMESVGYRVDYIDVMDDGKVDLDKLRNSICDDTALISVMYVNNETGAIQPIQDIINIKNSINPKVRVHVDAVQAYGKIDINLRKLKIDMLSISSHKIHGPKGVGCLFVRDGVKLESQMLGGGQEDGFRSGTENVPAIAAFAKASSIMNAGISRNYDKLTRIKNTFLQELAKTNIEYEVISTDDGLPYILNIAFLNTKSEVMLHHLEDRGIYVSTGSACSAKRKKYSHVLMAMGKKLKVVDSAIRFSFSHFNTEEEVRNTVLAIVDIVPYIYIKHGGKMKR